MAEGISNGFEDEIDKSLCEFLTRAFELSSD
jgi:hypothetical protein